MGRKNDKPRWHAVARTITQSDHDEQRAKTATVPGSLDGAVLLLVKIGDNPVSEYLYGVTARLEEAGKLAGFKVEPLPDGEEPQLPDGVNDVSHPLVPFRARLNRQQQMKELRTDWTGIRKSVEALMPDDSYVSMRFRSSGTVEDARIRNWVASEYSSVEDESDLVGANTMCARVSVGCSTSDANSKLLAKRVGQTVFPLLSSMGSHRSRPKFGLFFISLMLTLMVLAHPLLELAWRPTFDLGGVIHLPQAFVYGLACIVVVTFILLLVSLIPFVGLPRLFIMAGAGVALLYLLSGFLIIPLWVAVFPAIVSAVLAVRWQRWTAWDDIMQVPRHYWSYTSTRNAQDSDNSTKLGVLNNLTEVNAYGTQRTTLIIPPTILVAMVTPTGDAVALKQDLHPAPEPLTRGGIPLGVDQTGRETYILLSQLFGGIAIFGAAGRGKSVLSHGIMQWAISSRSTTDKSVWGADTRIIDFEMKDADGAILMDRYRAAHPTATPSTTMILADRHTPCIDLLGMKDGLDTSQTAANAAAAMQFSFEDGDIRGASLEVLKNALTIGIAVQRFMEAYITEHGAGGKHPVRDRMRELEPRYNGAGKAGHQATAMGWTFTALCGSAGQVGSARALGQVVRSLALEHPDNTDLKQAASAAEQLYGRLDDKVTASSDNRIIQNTQAVRNKIDRFMQCEHVFNRHRATLTWADVLREPSDWHVVLCDMKDRNGITQALPGGMQGILGKWLMYRLWNTVTTECQGWQAAGKHTMFVCDEMSLLATVDDTILSAMKDQGRSFGWIPVVATQYPEQLAPRLLTSVFGYSTFITFDNTDANMAARTALQLTSSKDGEDGWTAAAVQGLSAHHIALRTRDEEQLQPACIVKVTDFDRDYRSMGD